MMELLKTFTSSGMKQLSGGGAPCHRKECVRQNSYCLLSELYLTRGARAPMPRAPWCTCSNATSILGTVRKLNFPNDAVPSKKKN